MTEILSKNNLTVSFVLKNIRFDTENHTRQNTDTLVLDIMLDIRICKRELSGRINNPLFTVNRILKLLGPVSDNV